MSRTLSTGIDIGTHHVRVVVSERVDEKGKSVRRVLGTGSAESRGLRYGYIINTSNSIKSVREAVAHAEHASGISIRSAVISIGGIGLESAVGTGFTIISRADSEITDDDVERAIHISKDSLPALTTQNRRILHAVPLKFSIDGKEVYGRPAGMHGLKLEVHTFFITCLEQHLDDLIAVIEEAGIEVTDVVATPIAAAVVNLTKTQKIAGTLLANIGAETVSIVVYENDAPISLKVFPIGSTDITNDIALGLRIPIEEAEEIKQRGVGRSGHSRKQLEEIIVARLTDIFELIEAHLRKIGKSGLLPAGIVLTGGGSAITTIGELAKASLRLPSRIASVDIIQNDKHAIRDASWSVAYGLASIGLTDEKMGTMVHGRGTLLDQLTEYIRHCILWIKQFLP